MHGCVCGCVFVAGGGVAWDWMGMLERASTQSQRNTMQTKPDKGYDHHLLRWGWGGGGGEQREREGMKMKSKPTYP